MQKLVNRLEQVRWFGESRCSLHILIDVAVHAELWGSIRDSFAIKDIKVMAGEHDPC